MNIVEKVKWIASTIEIGDDHSNFNYFEDMMNNIFADDSDLPIIKEKMDNLIKLIKFNCETPEDFEKFLDLDFETEIWKML